MIRTYDDLPASLRADIKAWFASLPLGTLPAVAAVVDALGAVAQHVEAHGTFAPVGMG